MKSGRVLRGARPLQRIDLLIGGILVLAIAGTVLGVATYEDDRLGGFGIAWREVEGEVDPDAVPQAGAGTVEILANVTQENLTRAIWTVTVSGSAARVQPVEILVEVVSPTNETLSAETSLPAGATASVDVPLEFDLAPVPNATRVTGPTLEAARSALHATQSSTLGVGTWTVRVSLSPSAPGPLGAESFTVDALAALTHYEADLIPETPEVSRG